MLELDPQLQLEATPPHLEVVARHPAPEVPQPEAVVALDPSLVAYPVP